jgi:hypothetical protein
MPITTVYCATTGSGEASTPSTWKDMKSQLLPLGCRAPVTEPAWWASTSTAIPASRVT